MLKVLLIFLAVCICYSAGLPRKPNGQKIKSENACRTTADSRNPGAKCIFPFKFKGKTYNGCPPDLKDPSRRWCSTNTDSDGNHIRGGGNYGFCDPLHCPTDSDKASTEEVATGPRSANIEESHSEESHFEGVDHGECTIIYKEECKPIQIPYTDYVTKCGEVMVKECKGKGARKYDCMNVYKTECKNVPVPKYRAEKNCEKVAYKRCGENNELQRLGYDPTDAEDCEIEWKKYHVPEYKDTSTKVCTTSKKHICINKTLEACEFVTIKVPFTESVEQCETKILKKCAQHWACKDKGWTKDSESACLDDEFRDDPSSCIELPQTVCKPKEQTIEVEKKKRECKNIPYKDCSNKVPTTSCTYKKKREPTTFTQGLPHIVCQACETEYRSIYKTVYELQHVKKCMDMPKKICRYLDEKVCRNSGWSHKKICQYETMEKCYKKHEEICHTHSHKVPKSEEVIVPKTVCYKSYLGFVEGER